ncbi:ribosome recycling factor-domain-containing protein [Halenospora varia]|nr:ribosome recycling factor-domain-containing protein [Halenospora varia]
MPPPLPVRANTLKQLFFKSPGSLECSLITRTATLAQPLPQAFVAQRYPVSLRNFSNSTALHKKKSRADREQAAEAAEHAEPVEDPFDFSILDASIAKALDKLANDLSKLRTGGRFNPEVLENLRVHLDKNSKKSERLSDLAQVLPKGGRMLMVLVGEKEHVHAVTSTIQGAKDVNLQPQQDSENENQLNVPIPPPTKESRDLALSQASKTGETAKTAVQAARAVQQKRLRAMELKKAVRPDDAKKAHKEMEKVVEKGMGDVKKAVDTARKGMEQS